jgi:hypothetical protein
VQEGSDPPTVRGDEIDAVISDAGASAPEVTRLRDLAARIGQIEWALLRRTPPPEPSDLR